MSTIYTEQCLCSSLFPGVNDADPSKPGFLSKTELVALKEADSFDSNIHMDDGSMKGFGHDDQKEFRHKILSYLNQLHPALKRIVDLELKAGARIHSAGRDYPDNLSINVTMTKRFTNRYEGAEVKFSLVNDSHYWYADYVTTDQPRHLLIL
jgi:hypothetical protein